LKHDRIRDAYVRLAPWDVLEVRVDDDTPPDADAISARALALFFVAACAGGWNSAWTRPSFPTKRSVHKLVVIALS